MSSDPLDETIRGSTADDLRRKIAESKAKTAGLHEFMVDEEKRQGELILVEAAAFFTPDQLDILKRIGFGTCHIQQPNGSMKLVSVSVVRPQVDPWESRTPGSDVMFERAKAMSNELFGFTTLQQESVRHPRHVQDWVMKQRIHNDEPMAEQARRILDVADRMAKGEPPFVDSEGKPVAWSYLDDNGWPHTADGRLVDVPIVPKQALRDDQDRSNVARLVEAHKTLSKRINEEVGLPIGYTVSGPPRKPSLLRRLWTAWCEFWETPLDERWE